MIPEIAWAAFWVALVLTLWVVVLLVRVIAVGLEINRLAARILPAAQGIAGNTEALAQLEATRHVAGELLQGTQAIERVSGSIEEGVGSLAQTLALEGRS